MNTKINKMNTIDAKKTKNHQDFWKLDALKSKKPCANMFVQSKRNSANSKKTKTKQLKEDFVL